MDTLVTKAEIEALCKQVHDLKEMAEKKGAETEANLQKMVAEILAKHPGKTPMRKIQFDAHEDSGVDEIIEKMPKELVEELDQTVLLSKILQIPITQTKKWGKWCRKAQEFKIAMDTATAGEGLEWIPTGFSQQLIEKVHLQLKVMALFPTIAMPTNPYLLPIELDDVMTFGYPEQTGDTGQTLYPIGQPTTGTGQVSFTAKAHVARVMTSRELTEDSIVPLLPFLQQRLVRGVALGEEDIVVNGDTTATHMDNDTTSATSRRKIWHGLRGSSLQVQSYKTDLSTFNAANLRAQRAGMGVYGANPSALAYVCGIRGYVKNFLGLAEVITMEKYGPQATVLSGELAKFDGIPVVVSEKIREDLNASGVYDNSTKTKTVLHLVYRDGFMKGTRRDVNVQLLKELYAASGQYALLVDERFAFRDTYPLATNHTVDTGYNF